jgi:hypothetical protein
MPFPLSHSAGTPGDIPGASCFLNIPLSPTAETAWWAAYHCHTRETKYYSAAPFELKNSIWKGLFQAKSSTAVYSLNLKQCKIDYFCSICKWHKALVLNPWYLTSPPSASQLLFSSQELGFLNQDMYVCTSPQNKRKRKQRGKITPYVY